MAADARQLDALFETILSRKAGDPASSYTAKLVAGGTPLCARKLGEEAVETVVAALTGDTKGLISESADLLFHWLVLLAERGIEPAAVYA
ncbi:MAG: phosphoribosyl-ATP diphosphatase, partial [Parvibaculum sedimenti]